MPKRISNLASSLKQIGEIQVNDWDFMALMNKDVSELEFTRSLKRLGSIRVMEWDFRTVLPAVNKLARQEVDLVDILKRTARYKVMEWDVRTISQPDKEIQAEQPAADPQEVDALILRLKNFLEYVAINIIDHPEQARIDVRRLQTNVLRFKLVLAKKDAVILIGKDGLTAAAIRNTMKARAGMHGVHALLEILSHEEDTKQKR